MGTKKRFSLFFWMLDTDPVVEAARQVSLEKDPDKMKREKEAENKRKKNEAAKEERENS